MAVFCPRCERQYPGTLFTDGATLLCACGATLRPPARDSRGRARTPNDHRKDQRMLGEHADRVCRMILSLDFPDVDVEIERGRVRALAETLFPDRMELYEMIYESRFDRLWQQFRANEREREI